MINLAGKKGVIMGVANELSIAWGIAKQLSDSGAELCFTYQGDALFKRVKPLAESIQNNFIIECNVLNLIYFGSKLFALISATAPPVTTPGIAFDSIVIYVNCFGLVTYTASNGSING